MITSDHHYLQLKAIQRRYSNKRSLGYGLVDECLRLVESIVAENEAHAAGRIATVEGYHETTKNLAETLRGRVKQLEDQLAEKRALREARDRAGDEVKVTIDRSLGGWTVADLEEIAYRLRSGGAVDDTPVKVTDHSASALVPAPDLVRLERPTRAPVRDDFDYTTQDLTPRAPDMARASAWPWKFAGAGVVLALLVDLVWRVIA